MADYYFANTFRFPHETIDGETVLIDSKSGYLYLFTGIGSALWERFLSGGTIDVVVAELISLYGPQAEASTRQFLENLVDEKLLVSRAPTVATGSPILETSWPDTFTVPEVERYDEISAIMSMDPIHQVDQAKGWPRQPDKPE